MIFLKSFHSKAFLLISTMPISLKNHLPNELLITSLEITEIIVLNGKVYAIKGGSIQ
jgi:hypothetical protein